MSQKILLVDDDQDFALVLTTRLEANGYEVSVAHNGKTGMFKFENEKPDLIVVDLVMPEMDGYTMLKELRRNNLLGNTPVIVLTAREGLKDLLAMEGVRDYLVKPFGTEELLDRIRWNLKAK